ncbi:hypothetical protein [Colwellia sp. UCD-KL20]|uniref:hypothetical protein n=1 Tax=Colwellia sp. UCD-KL20 TaxID=1917165 RepID=UPI0015C3D78B|nr:hypothetical protein [Colwellia sp. UCD-KL20]
MKKYTLMLISIYLSGCSNFQYSNDKESVVKQAEVNQVCQKVLRHKSVIKRCRAIVSR